METLPQDNEYSFEFIFYEGNFSTNLFQFK